MEDNIDLILHGCDGLGDTPMDYEIGGEISLPIIDKLDNIRIEYNQGNSLNCTLYSPIGQISDLFNYTFSPEEIQEIVDLSYAQGRSPKGGWVTMLGTKCVCGRWNNKFPDKKVLFYTIDLLSNNFNDAKKKGYSVTATYQGNHAYNLDFMVDGTLDGIEYKPASYGHCIEISGMEETGADDNNIKDNYKGRPHNYYKLKDLQGLIEKGTFYAKGYLILPEKNVTNTVEQMKALANQKILLTNTMQGISDLWHSYPDTAVTIKEQLHEQNNMLRGLLNDVNLKMGVI